MVIAIGNTIAHDTKMRTPDVKRREKILIHTAYRLSFSKTIPAAQPPMYDRINVAFSH
mgnify:FL=1